MTNSTTNTIRELLIEQAFNRCTTRHERQCSALSDQDFLMFGVERVIEMNISGRDILQARADGGGDEIARSTYFDALQSNRRRSYVSEVSKRFFDYTRARLKAQGVDYLAPFEELKGYDVYAGDGHYIEHACHTAKVDGKIPSAPGNIFLMELRYGIMQLFANASDGSRKNHEMPIFRKCVERELSPSKQIYVLDMAFIGYGWWLSRANRNQYVVSRVRGGDAAVRYCGEHDFDRANPTNAGVVRDRSGAFSSGGRAVRIIEYIDPENGEEFMFYTTLGRSIKPGVICRLYFLRWQIEKSFDCFKNSLRERKAWATGSVAIEIQGLIMTLVFNFERLLLGILKTDHGISDTKAEKKYKNDLDKRQTKAKAIGRFVHPLMWVASRISRFSEQFIRVIRNHFMRDTTLADLLGLFAKRMAAYL